MITGGIKFFIQNYALFRNGAAVTATSNSEGAKAMSDVSRYTQWVSVGSNDTTTEELTITFPEAKLIDRIFLVDMNFKEFNITYFDTTEGIYKPFTNVIGINAEVKTGISETAFSKTSAYYEFDAISVGTIKVSITKSQVANAQKYLTTFIATKEIGTLKGFPRVDIDSDRNESKTETLSNKMLVQKGMETVSVTINFKSHPYQEDLTILDYLFDSDEPFLVYPCGGRSGLPYFRIEQKGYKPGDVFYMQTVGRMPNDYEKGIYTLGFNKAIKMVEHI